MGTEHIMLCRSCKEFIDLHKCYALYRLLTAEDCPFDMEDGDQLDKWWDLRGVWFAWHHRGHKGPLEIMADFDDDYWNIKAENGFKEVKECDDEIKKREKVPIP